jgi:hypothetical protein
LPICSFRNTKVGHSSHVSGISDYLCCLGVDQYLSAAVRLAVGKTYIRGSKGRVLKCRQRIFDHEQETGFGDQNHNQAAAVTYPGDPNLPKGVLSGPTEIWDEYGTVLWRQSCNTTIDSPSCSEGSNGSGVLTENSSQSDLLSNNSNLDREDDVLFSYLQRTLSVSPMWLGVDRDIEALNSTLAEEPDQVRMIEYEQNISNHVAPAMMLGTVGSQFFTDLTELFGDDKAHLSLLDENDALNSDDAVMNASASEQCRLQTLLLPSFIHQQSTETVPLLRQRHSAPAITVEPGFSLDVVDLTTVPNVAYIPISKLSVDCDNGMESGAIDVVETNLVERLHHVGIVETQEANAEGAHRAATTERNLDIFMELANLLVQDELEVMDTESAMDFDGTYPTIIDRENVSCVIGGNYDEACRLLPHYGAISSKIYPYFDALGYFTLCHSRFTCYRRTHGTLALE